MSRAYFYPKPQSKLPLVPNSLKIPNTFEEGSRQHFLSFSWVVLWVNMIGCYKHKVTKTKLRLGNILNQPCSLQIIKN